MAIYSDENIDFLQRKICTKPQSMVLAHFHENHELYYLIEGTARYFISDEIFILEPGDMIFVPKGEFHQTVYNESGVTDRVLFTFDDNFLGENFKKYIDEMKKDKLITFSKDKSIKIYELINKCIKEKEKNKKGYDDMKNLLLGELLISISRYRNRETPPITPVYTAMQDIAKYITSNYNTDLSLNTLSKLFSISPNHLSRQFKKVTGVGLSEYINITRITIAEKMLLDNNISITEVATQCGFNDSNYFASVFKKIKGITPKKYSLQNT